MSRNWLRSCYLSLSGNSQKVVSGGGPTDLRIEFAIKQWSQQAPNMAHFRVYNPSPDMVSKLRAKEYTKIDFYAGYQDNVGLVFSGDYKQSIYGHETAVDSYVDIFAADGDTTYNSARVTKTLAAGYTPQDKLQVALDSFAQMGVTLGVNTLDLSQPKYPRGIPLIGMARDIIREVVLSKGGVWSIQLGQVKIADKTLDTGGSTIALSASTGLVGWPKQTDLGIEVTSLLNPNLQPHVKISLDPSGIIAAEQNNNPFDGPAQETNTNLNNQMLGAGTYIIYHLDRSGDTRGQQWYDVSICVGVGGSIPKPVMSSNPGYWIGQD